jgi:hypothetical protein
VATMQWMISITVLSLGTVAFAAPYDGVYYAAGSPPRAVYTLVSSGDDVYVLERAVATRTKPQPRGAGWALSPLDLVVAPNGAAWQLNRRGQTFAQLSDPFFARVLQSLKGKQLFAQVDPDHPRDRQRGTLTLIDGLFALFDDPGKACWSSLLIPDYTQNGARPLTLTPAQPNTIGARTFIAAKSPLGDCHAPLAGAERIETHGMGGGAHVFADKSANVIGFAVVGYMDAALYVAKGHSVTELRDAFQRFAH